MAHANNTHASLISTTAMASLLRLEAHYNPPSGPLREDKVLLSTYLNSLAPTHPFRIKMTTILQQSLTNHYYDGINARTLFPKKALEGLSKLEQYLSTTFTVRKPDETDDAFIARQAKQKIEEKGEEKFLSLTLQILSPSLYSEHDSAWVNGVKVTRSLLDVLTYITAALDDDRTHEGAEAAAATEPNWKAFADAVKGIAYDIDDPQYDETTSPEFINGVCATGLRHLLLQAFRMTPACPDHFQMLQQDDLTHYIEKTLTLQKILEQSLKLHPELSEEIFQRLITLTTAHDTSLTNPSVYLREQAAYESFITGVQRSLEEALSGMDPIVLQAGQHTINKLFQIAEGTSSFEYMLTDRKVLLERYPEAAQIISQFSLAHPSYAVSFLADNLDPADMPIMRQRLEALTGLTDPAALKKARDRLNADAKALIETPEYANRLAARAFSHCYPADSRTRMLALQRMTELYQLVTSKELLQAEFEAIKPLVRQALDIHLRFAALGPTGLYARQQEMGLVRHAFQSDQLVSFMRLLSTPIQFRRNAIALKRDLEKLDLLFQTPGARYLEKRLNLVESENFALLENFFAAYQLSNDPHDFYPMLLAAYSALPSIDEIFEYIEAHTSSSLAEVDTDPYFINCLFLHALTNPALAAYPRFTGLLLNVVQLFSLDAPTVGAGGGAPDPVSFTAKNMAESYSPVLLAQLKDLASEKPLQLGQHSFVTFVLEKWSGALPSPEAALLSFLTRAHSRPIHETPAALLDFLLSDERMVAEKARHDAEIQAQRENERIAQAHAQATAERENALIEASWRAAEYMIPFRLVSNQGHLMSDISGGITKAELKQRFSMRGINVKCVMFNGQSIYLDDSNEYVFNPNQLRELHLICVMFVIEHACYVSRCLMLKSPFCVALF